MSEWAEVVKWKGDLYRGKLEKIFKSAGLNLAGVASEGVLCCDVGGGEEIALFNPYDPKIFVVSEPTTHHYDRLMYDQALNELANKYPNITVLRQSIWNVLPQLKGKSTFGLITWLNVFPEFVTANLVKKFFREADSLLIPEGVSMMSIDRHHEDAAFGVGLYTGGIPILREMGYTIHDPDPGIQTSAGGLFMIGVKPKRI